jgi:dolichyl-phosphate-mannose-protein mannosyltransferase
MLVQRFVTCLMVLVCALGALVFCHSRAAAAEKNLVINGDLSRGAKNVPYQWFGTAQSRKLTDFGWQRGELRMTNRSPNYASWHQILMLRPGWYRVGAMARIEGARDDGPGITVAVKAVGGERLASNALHGTSDWSPVALYLHVAKWGETSELLLQLGDDHDPETGSALFRDVQVTQIDAPPPDASPVYELGQPVATSTPAAAPPPAGFDYQRPLGVICGTALIMLLAICLATIWRPAIARPSTPLIAGVLVMVVIATVEFALLYRFEGYFWDIWQKTNRALLAVKLGPRDIYNPGLPVDSYPPGSLYLLWLSGWLGRVFRPSATGFRVLVESPPVMASMLLGLTILFAARREGSGWRAFAIMSMFAFNPALVFDTVVWGQSDSVVALAMLAAAILIVSGRWRLGWIAAAIALLVKPQAIAIVPPLGLWTLISAGLGETVLCAALSGATMLLGVLPFVVGHPPNWIIEVYRTLGSRFTDASVGAFNLHALLGGLETPDSVKVALVSYYALGMSAIAGAFVIVAFLVWRARSANTVMLATFIAMLALFVFAPRMHERYTYYPLVFLVPLALESRVLTAAYAVLTATSFFNLYFMKYLSDSSSFFSNHAHWPVGLASALNLALFVVVTAYALFRVATRREPRATGSSRLAAEEAAIG